MLDFLRVIPKKRTIGIRHKKGIIYNNPPKSKRFIFYLGNLFLLFSLIYLTYLYYPLTKALIEYQIKPKNENNNKEIQTIRKELKTEKRFLVEIPKILAKSQIIANVSPFDKNEYLKVLSNNLVAHAKGSALPGSGFGKTVYIFAHSTQQGFNMVKNNSVFYLLDKLKNDDLVFIEYSGKTFIYKIYQKKIIDSSETKYFIYKENDKEILILQTCWPIGTDWKRLLIFAKLIEN